MSMCIQEAPVWPQHVAKQGQSGIRVVLRVCGLGVFKHLRSWSYPEEFTLVFCNEMCPCLVLLP